MSFSHNNISLKVVSFNIWGLPDLFNNAPKKMNSFGYHKVSRNERINRIINRIQDFDVICFQEVWLRSDRYKLINGGINNGLKYWRYFHSGRSFYSLSKFIGFNESFDELNTNKASGFGIGSGMLILSRYPISFYNFKGFKLCGKPQRIHHGDYQGSKGIGMVTINLTDSIKVDIYTTHVVAGYSFKDEYKAQRLTNFIDYIEFINENSSNNNHFVIITGDLNNIPNSIEVEYFRKYLSLIDTIEEIHSNINISSHIFECKRLDYILYIPNKQLNWKVDESCLCFINNSFEKELQFENSSSLFYSDHKGIYTKFIYSTDYKNEKTLQILDKQVKNDAIQLLEKRTEKAKERRFIHFKRFIILLILSILIYIIPIIPQILQIPLIIILLFGSLISFIYMYQFKQQEIQILEQVKYKIQQINKQ